MEKVNVVWDNVMRDENARIYPDSVTTDFELQVRKEVDAWIKKQPADKSWATPVKAYQQFWNERLN
jgi:hypothetical protein